MKKKLQGSVFRDQRLKNHRFWKRKEIPRDTEHRNREHKDHCVWKQWNYYVPTGWSATATVFFFFKKIPHPLRLHHHPSELIIIHPPKLMPKTFLCEIRDDQNTLGGSFLKCLFFKPSQWFGTHNTRKTWKLWRVVFRILMKKNSIQKEWQPL